VRKRVADDWLDAVDCICAERPHVLEAWAAAEAAELRVA
jgi:hypothetical protein